MRFVASTTATTGSKFAAVARTLLTMAVLGREERRATTADMDVGGLEAAREASASACAVPRGIIRSSSSSSSEDEPSADGEGRGGALGRRGLTPNDGRN